MRLVIQCAALWLALSVCLSSARASAPDAPAAQTQIDIPGQNAEDAVKSLARAFGRPVLFQAEDVASVSSNAVKGRYSIERALAVMFEGTDLLGGLTEGGVITVSLRPIAEASGGDKPMKASRFFLATALSSVTAAANAIAQDAPSPANPADEVIVVGSRIQGVADSGALPVTVVDRDALDVFGADSTGDLLANIPAVGDFEFRDNNTGTNGARGDVSGINLRGVGSGSTLVLLNGRRVAAHPANEAVGSVPVTFFNVNAIPATMINRVEVLRDGASALYGTDAIAGVVNFSLYDDYEGLYLSGKYGAATEHSMEEWTVAGRAGWRSDDGRTYFSIGGSHFDRSPVQYTELGDPWFGTLDRREMVPPPFEGDTDWDNRSTIGPYGRFTSGVLNPDGTFTGVRVRQNGVNITNTAGLFHMQPNEFSGGVPTTQGLELDDGSQERDLRYDFIADETAIPETRRTSLAANFKHEFGDNLEFFVEGLYYDSFLKTQRAAGPFDASLALIIVPAASYWNPFGPVGSPNRLANIDAPAEGLDIVIEGYRPLEMGPRLIEVDQTLWRVLGGLRGELKGWDWEYALGYSKATVADEEFNRISKTLLQNSVSLTTPDAFNPFGGPFVNSEAVLESIRVSSIRAGKSTLLTWDLNASRSDLMRNWAGDIGMAWGLEYRRETIFEDSDPRLDGTIQFTNGAIPDESDLVGVSATNDFGGERDVISVYGELAVPLVAADNNIPLVHSVDLQIAGRFEHFSDFGDAIKPKAALHWFLTPDLSLRGSYARGFRAPNLVQINQGTITRRNQGDADPWREDVTMTANDLGDTYRPSLRFGNPDLDPEQSQSYTGGVIYKPEGGALEGLRLSADYWHIDTEDAITVIGVDTQLELDFELRMMGSFNPDVIRADVTPADQAAFDAYNLLNPTMTRQAAGEVLLVNDGYINLENKKVSGLDFSGQYRIPEFGFGQVTVGADATYLLKFEETSQGVIIDQIRRNANPEWRLNASASWRLGGFSFAAQMRRVGSVEDTSANAGDELWLVEPWTTVNLLAGVEFGESSGSILNGVELKFGVRNVGNNLPSYADESPGYFSGLHNVEGRVVYGQISKEF